eukprot:COSAG04_NODE_23824_length_331_cov_1.064655_1_plen_55_part_10
MPGGPADWKGSKFCLSPTVLPRGGDTAARLLVTTAPNCSAPGRCAYLRIGSLARS